MLKNFFVTALILILLGISVFVGYNTFRSKEKYLDFEGMERRYRVHLPKGYDKNKKYPLVLAFHGIFENPRLFEMVTGLSRKADEEGFVVVYPQGTKGRILSPYTWNADFCCGYAVENNVNDVGFTNSLIDELLADYSIDSTKIYLVGFSNGGMFVHKAASQLADRIAAAAVVSSAVGGMAEEEEEFTFIERMDKPLPILIIHGKEDRTVPFEGGESSYQVMQFTAAYDTVNFWLDNNMCLKHPSSISKTDHFTHEIYDQCNSNSVVSFYAINTDHVWAGGLYEFAKNISKRSIDATDLVWQFFAGH
jgi:polyhydroxybutyrate depolymerase